MWYNCATPAFLEAYGTVRKCVHVHACRISARLLHAIHTASSAGLVGYGEMAVVTICRGEGMVWRELEPRHLGTPYDPHRSMSQEEWEALGPIRRNKLYHALKW